MYFGLHIATGGKLLDTPKRAQQLDTQTMQVFISNPRGWRQTTYTDEQAKDFRLACRQAGLKSVFAHMIYLVGYGSANEELREKSNKALRQAMSTADALGISGLVTHLGSHQGLGFEQALSRLAEGLSEGLASSHNTEIILENSAGAGGNIGNSLEELAQILEALKGHPRVKICLDTAHLLGAGYEIRDPKSWDDFLVKFDQLIGMDRLRVMHLNDSKAPLGSRLDRHENIGFGEIGRKGFRAILGHAKLKDVPGILEVPGMDNQGPDLANLQALRELS